MKVKLINKEIQNNYAQDLLAERGVTDFDSFLDPTEDNVQNPKDLINIACAMNKVQTMIGERKPILLLIDSDCDGFCSAAIIYQYLKEVEPNLNIEIVAHEEKGHGLRDIVQREDINIGAYSYMIIPDASTNDVEHFAEYPETYFIVLDHHESDDEELCTMGSNYVIVNNQLSPEYENKALCGAGVVWQFCRYLEANSIGSDREKYTDLAAVATVSDIMDSRELENRYIVDYGLTHLNNELILELIGGRNDVFTSLEDVTQDKLAWYVTPMINGMCRSGSYDEKLRLFEAMVDGSALIQDTKRGAKKGDLVTKAENSAREARNAKSRQDSRKKKMSALAQIKIEELQLLDNKTLVLVLDERFEDLPTTLNGLVANQLAQELGRPVLVGRIDSDGYLSGSGRGSESVDMEGFASFLLKSEMFEYVSGHQNAFGFKIHSNLIDKYHEWANKELSHVDININTHNVNFIRRGNDQDIPAIVYDIDLHSHLWGNANKPPLIAIQSIVIDEGDVNVIGRYANTVKIVYHNVEYLFFRLTEDQVAEFSKYDVLEIDVVGTMSVNSWMGKNTPQIIVNDYIISDGKFAF